jgi:NTP pyrophosphatase (non-canonical NTP hydrolase)
MRKTRRRPSSRPATSGWRALIQELRQFRDARDWKQFHNPKDLAAAVAIEAGELQERFLWRTPAQIENDLLDRRSRAATVDELADVLICALLFADCLGIEIDRAIRSKMRKNARKYPVRKAKGTARKYSELGQR